MRYYSRSLGKEHIPLAISNKASLRSWLSWGCCALAAAGLVWSGSARTFRVPSVNRPGLQSSAQIRKNGLPFYFEANQGRADERVAFLAQARGYVAFLEPAGVVLNFGPLSSRGALWKVTEKPETHPAPQPVRLRFVGASPNASLHGVEAQAGKVHSFLRRDKGTWHRNIATFARLQAEQVYPGIDLRYYGGEHRQHPRRHRRLW